ncbi:cobalt-precorrin-6A reductase [Clostridium sp. C2-6-12]|uniref:cobalt-precorrin-6A reductase n=1 Tax=Clostridium sp. C2-6-12 TaxID=2698832 RepID=UPI001368187A|nr:cobalt-precorrin-6A reductase [Clostridium sp. C2-6-12]
MIGFILGTSEGKKILELINKYTNDIAVTTATTYGGQILKEFDIKVLNTKPLNEEEMLNWLIANEINVLVDASHPYAEEVTKIALKCSNTIGIQYFRFERPGVLENINLDNIIRVKNYDEAIEVIEEIDGNVLNTTGGNNVSKFLNLDFKYRVIHRILPLPKVLNKIVEAGISIKDIIAMQGPITYELEKAFIYQYDAKAILTKDSGIEGGTLEKYKAVTDAEIKLILIERPNFNGTFVFTSEEELVEHLVKECCLNK